MTSALTQEQDDRGRNDNNDDHIYREIAVLEMCDFSKKNYNPVYVSYIVIINTIILLLFISPTFSLAAGSCASSLPGVLMLVSPVVTISDVTFSDVTFVACVVTGVGTFCVWTVLVRGLH